MWEREHPNLAKMRTPYRCGSWRCPECRVHEAHVAWKRITDAFAPLPANATCMLVLTLDRYGTYSGKKRWANAQEAYRDLSRLSNEFLKRLRKWCKRSGWDVLANQWVCSVEAHESGWPHVNYVLSSRGLAAWLRDEKVAKMRDGMSEEEANRVSGELADIVTGSGWGLISTAECARSVGESVGYIVKVAGKVDESIGELAKLSQLPLKAPFRFRRIRSGKGFLPPRAKSEFMSGTLVRRQNSNDGTRDVLPLHDIKNLDTIPLVESCCLHEEKVWIAELEREHRCARQVKQFGRAAIELPPVTRWFNYQRLDTTTMGQHRHDSILRPKALLSEFGRGGITPEPANCNADLSRASPVSCRND